MAALACWDCQPTLAVGLPNPFVVGWTQDGNLNYGRAAHTATLLQNGDVLVVGGNDGLAQLPTAELYDPSNGHWTLTGSLPTGRAGQTATLLQNGKVLLTGGVSGDSELASAELYDPTTGKWSSAGNMTTVRSTDTATLLPDGKVLVAGGTDQSEAPLASAELYDPASNSWSPTGDLETGRYAATATLLTDGDVLVAGGWGIVGGVYRLLSSAELYNPATGTWSAAASMPAPRDDDTATLLLNGKVLVAGGPQPTGSATAELYDPTTNRWSAAGSMVLPREQQTATLLNDGRVLLAGGQGPSPQIAELYDPASNTWYAAGTLTDPRFGHTATLLGDGTVLIVGGSSAYSGEDVLFGTDVYTPGPIPQVQTGVATGVGQTTATVGGSVNPFKIPLTDCHFDYGTSPAYGSSAKCSQTPYTITGPVSASLTQLQPNTRYYYRLVVANAAVTAPGPQGAFTTLPVPPPLQQPQCSVPKVTGLSLSAARRALKAADCRVGRIRHARPVKRKPRRGKRRVTVVGRQSLRPGTVQPAGTRVGLTLVRKTVSRKR